MDDLVVRIRQPLDSNTRFEVIGELFHLDTGYLRPGKDDVFGDSCSDENRARFDQWFATRAFNSAIERIAALQERVDRLERSESP